MKDILTIIAAIMLVSAPDAQNNNKYDTPAFDYPGDNHSGNDHTGKYHADTLPVSFDVAKSGESRITSPDTTASQLSSLVSGNSAFAFNLYQQLTKNNSGTFSIHLTVFPPLGDDLCRRERGYGDTDGECAGFHVAAVAITPAFNDLALQLASRGQVPAAPTARVSR